VDPPQQVCELRALLQLYRDLREEHAAWTQRIHATLFHQGVPSLVGRLSDPQARARLATGTQTGLSPAGARAVAVALRRMDDLDAELAPVYAQIMAFARRQIGCKALARELYGVGPLVAAIVWALLGDARRFSFSAQAVRPLPWSPRWLTRSWLGRDRDRGVRAGVLRWPERVDGAVV
jgi:transposase